MKEDFSLLKISSQMRNFSDHFFPKQSQITKQMDWLQVFEDICKRVMNKLPIVTTPTRLCLKPSKFYFYCRTCCYDVDTGVCDSCFDEKLHQGHNYSKMSYKMEFCDCGMVDKWDSRVYCKSHSYYSNSYLSEDDQNLYQSFMSLGLKTIHFFLKNQFYRKQCSIFHKDFFQCLLVLNKNSNFYNQITARILTKTEQEYKLLYYIIRSLISSQFWSPLFDCLANCDRFLYIFLKTIFTTIKNAKQLKSNMSIKLPVQKFADTTRILNQLARNNLLIYQNGNNQDRFSFYLDICSRLKSNRKQTQAYGMLTDVWKCCISNKIPIFQSIKAKHIGIIFEDALKTQIFLPITELFFRFIIFKKQNNSHYFSALMINSMFEVILIHLEGEHKQIVNFFKKLTLTKKEILKIMDYYLTQVLSAKSYSHINSFVFEGFMEIASEFEIDLEEKCREIWQAQAKFLNFKIGTEIVSTYLGKFIINKEKKLNFMYKCLKNGNNQKMKQQCQHQLESWLRRYLFSIGEIDRVSIIKMKQKGLFDFPGAKRIFEQETIYNEENYSFRYIGEQQNFDNDCLIKMKEPFGITFLDQNNPFTSPKRKHIFRLLASQLYQQLNKIDIKTQISKVTYNVCLKAVILDKIMESQDPNIHKFCLTLKKLKPRSLVSENKYYHLFGLEKTKTDIGIQSLTENQVKIDIEKTVTVLMKNIEQVQVKDYCCQIDFEEQKIEQVVCQKQDKVQQKIEQKKEEVKLSKAQLLKQKKMKMLQQKYTRIAKNYLPEEEQEQQESTCLICKDYNPQNPLVYCASLKRDKYSKIFNNNFQTIGDYFFFSCFHLVHVKCLKKQSKPKCPLCKQSYNIFFPKQSKMDKQKARANLQNLREQLEKNEKQKFSIATTTLYLLKSLINKCGVSQMWFSNSDMDKKNYEYCYSILEEYSSVLNEDEVRQIQKLLMCEIDANVNAENNIIFADIERLLSRILFQKVVLKGVRNKTLEQANFLLDLVQHKHDLTLLGRPLSKCYELIEKPINFQFKKIQNEVDQWEQLLGIIDLPQNATQLLRMRRKCQKCLLLEEVYCIICRQTFCHKCKDRSHNQTHNTFGAQSYLLLHLDNGCLKQVKNLLITKSYCLYEDVFRDQFDKGEINPSEFKLNKKIYIKALSAYLKN